MEDTIAVSGLQAEVYDPSAPKKKGPGIKPVGYIRHHEARYKEGFPTRRNWNEIKERKAREEFTRSLDTNPNFVQLDLTSFGGGKEDDGESE